MKEPCQAGADLVVGSLIKNPGGGIAPTGGYIAGRKDLVELCAYRLNAPGLFDGLRWLSIDRARYLEIEKAIEGGTFDRTSLLLAKEGH